MKNLKRVSAIAILLSMILSINTFAMTSESGTSDIGFTALQPSDDQEYEDRFYMNRFTWLNDDLCVRFQGSENINTSVLLRKWDVGLLSRWIVWTNNAWKIKTRDTYTGKWTQSPEGVWSFKFDDYTIPVGITKIDDVLYAFNGFGELAEGVEYWNGQKTGADGVVNNTEPVFLKWLETQYVPACKTSKE